MKSITCPAYGNHFLDSLFCILNHNFYRNICKGCYAPQMRQGLDKYSYRNGTVIKHKKDDFRVPELRFPNFRIRDFEPPEFSNSTYRKLNCQRSVFPRDTALLKALYLANFEAAKKWTLYITLH